MHYGEYRDKKRGGLARNQPGRLAAYLLDRPNTWVGGWDLALAIGTTALATIISAIRNSQAENPDMWTIEHEQRGDKHFYRARIRDGFDAFAVAYICRVRIPQNERATI